MIEWSCLMLFQQSSEDARQTTANRAAGNTGNDCRRDIALRRDDKEDEAGQ
jgi:hypothetical protein